jgi:putative spermidine/putrescine transport system ATP-binding protein
LLALLGPSGCGKTTIMRAVAGLMAPRAGRILLAGRDITRLAPNRREIGLVFQSYALFPHLSVFENVAFGLRLRGTAGVDMRRLVDEAIAGVGLKGFEARTPRELSGGQQQRVALARSLVVKPRLLLLDEPLSNLDARLRLEMRGELRRLQRELGTTMIYVTHDQAEALALADRLLVMNAGRIEQSGRPEEIYERPKSAFVARFMGFENVFAVKDGAAIGPAGGGFPLPAALAPDVTGLAWRPRGVTVGTGPFAGRLRAVSYLGDAVEYLIDSPFGQIRAEAATGAAPGVLDGEVRFDLPLDRAASLKS